MTIAAVIAIPELFGEIGRQILFAWATGSRIAVSLAFAAIICFGNAVLLTCVITKAAESSKGI